MFDVRHRPKDPKTQMTKKMCGCELSKDRRTYRIPVKREEGGERTPSRVWMTMRRELKLHVIIIR